MAYPALFSSDKIRSETLTRPAALNRANPMAYRPIGLCGMGEERLEGKGLEGGHTLQAKEMSRLVAPFRARFYFLADPQASQTSGLCTLGLMQFKAAGLVQAFDLLVHNNCSE